MCETIDLIVFQPKIAISTVKTKVTAVASVPSGMIGEKIPKYPPREWAADRTESLKPLESGSTFTIPAMRPVARLIMASVIMLVGYLHRAYE